MRNLTMMTDLYELTMMNGYLRFGMENNRACFDIFYYIFKISYILP